MRAHGGRGQRAARAPAPGGVGAAGRPAAESLPAGGKGRRPDTHTPHPRLSKNGRSCSCEASLSPSVLGRDKHPAFQGIFRWKRPSARCGNASSESLPSSQLSLLKTSRSSEDEKLLVLQERLEQLEPVQDKASAAPRSPPPALAGPQLPSRPPNPGESFCACRVVTAASPLSPPPSPPPTVRRPAGPGPRSQGPLRGADPGT